MWKTIKKKKKKTKKKAKTHDDDDELMGRLVEVNVHELYHSMATVVEVVVARRTVPGR